MRAQEFIIEAFNQPYPLKWERGEHGDYDALATLNDGTYLSIMFNNEGNNEWHVEFYRNNSQEVTGEGDAYRIFSTVLTAIQQFIQKQQPWRLIFSASKDVEPGQNSESRAKLYNSLVARYARAWGYDEYNEDHGDQVTYELTRIENDAPARIDELYNPETSFPIEWDDHFGPEEMHGRAYDRQGGYIDIKFIPLSASTVEVEFSRNDSYDMTGGGDANRVLGTVLEAFREYLRGYQPRVFIFSAKGGSRSKVYQSLIKRFADSVGYRQFDMSKLSPEKQAKIAASGSDVMVLRKVAP